MARYAGSKVNDKTAKTRYTYYYNKHHYARPQTSASLFADKTWLWQNPENNWSGEAFDAYRQSYIVCTPEGDLRHNQQHLHSTKPIHRSDQQKCGYKHQDVVSTEQLENDSPCASKSHVLKDLHAVDLEDVSQKLGQSRYPRWANRGCPERLNIKHHEWFSTVWIKTDSVYMSIKRA